MENERAEANNKVLEFIGNPDSAPSREREVTFWFYAEEEKQGYLFADKLKKEGFEILELRKSLDNKYLILVGKEMVCSEEQVNSYCELMESLAREFEVEFDGWETMINP